MCTQERREVYSILLTFNTVKKDAEMQIFCDIQGQCLWDFVPFSVCELLSINWNALIISEHDHVLQRLNEF